MKPYNFLCRLLAAFALVSLVALFAISSDGQVLDVHVLPVPPDRNVLDGGWGDTELLGYFLPRMTSGAEALDLNNFFDRQLCLVVPLTNCTSPLARGVSMVVRVRPEEEMIRVRTRRVVTAMAQPHAFWNLAAMQQPRSVRSADIFRLRRVAANYPIAVPIASAFPLPTASGFNGISPKPFSERHALALSTTDSLRPLLFGLPIRKKHALTA